MMQPVGDFSPTDLRRLLGGGRKGNTMDTKPGYKTTEFWLSLAAMVIGAVLASGVLNPSDATQAKVLQVLGLVATLLASLGYTAQRGLVKSTASKAAAIASAAASSAPSSDPK
jgi:hypothetical protein